MKMRIVALPGEITAWRKQFAHLPRERQARVIKLLAHVVGDCAVCDDPVRRCDPRVLVDGGFQHKHCTGGDAR